METSQYKILDYCLKNAVFDGWNNKLLENASKAAGLDVNYHRILFPNGLADIFLFFVEYTNQKMQESVNLQGLGTTKKVEACVIWRLEQIKPYKQSIKLLLKALALRADVTLKAAYSAVDSIWRLCGDTSTDFNFYSKRGLLAAVYASTLAYFMQDDSANNQKTLVFLSSRLKNVASFGKFIGKIKAAF